MAVTRTTCSSQLKYNANMQQRGVDISSTAPGVPPAYATPLPQCRRPPVGRTSAAAAPGSVCARCTPRCTPGWAPCRWPPVASSLAQAPTGGNHSSETDLRGTHLTTLSNCADHAVQLCCLPSSRPWPPADAMGKAQHAGRTAHLYSMPDIQSALSIQLDTMPPCDSWFAGSKTTKRRNSS